MQLQRIKDYWGTIVLAEIFILIFVTGFFPQHWLPVVGPVLYSLLYLSTAMALGINRRRMIRVAAVLLVAQGLFKIFNWPVIEAISKGLNIIFFVIIKFVILVVIIVGFLLQRRRRKFRRRRRIRELVKAIMGFAKAV